jgi:hypothetical protein
LITLALQWVSATLLSIFAVLTLLVARRAPAETLPVERAAWYVTGVVFVTQCVLTLLQLFAGTIAFARGPESRWFIEYVQLMPVGNHSRGLLSFLLSASLLVLLIRGPVARGWRTSLHISIIVAVALGVGVGLVEASTWAHHWRNVAYFEAASVVLLLGVLFAALFRPVLDRWLWAGLAIYACVLALSSIYIAALAWVDGTGAWTPTVWHLAVFRAVLHSGMVACAAWRLRLALEERPVANLLQTGRSPSWFPGASHR